MLCLIAEQGPDAGQVFVAKSNCAVVGQDGEIALNDRAVSSYHALLQVQIDGRIIITDLNSKNGTWLGYGERPVEQITLKSGMCFRVGNTVLRIQPDEAIANYPVQISPVPRPRTPELHLARTTRMDALVPSRQPQIQVASEARPQAHRKASLELEFNPEILAAANEKTQTELLELDEPETLVLPAPPPLLVQPQPTQTLQTYYPSEVNVSLPNSYHLPVPEGESAVLAYPPQILAGSTTLLITMTLSLILFFALFIILTGVVRF